MTGRRPASRGAAAADKFREACLAFSQSLNNARPPEGIFHAAVQRERPGTAGQSCLVISGLCAPLFKPPPSPETRGAPLPLAPHTRRPPPVRAANAPGRERPPP